MEALCAEGAGDEVSLVTKRATEVAHLFKDQTGIIKRAPNGIWVVAALVVLSLVMLHYFLAVFVLHVNGVEH